jgi:hypothetical protein
MVARLYPADAVGGAPSYTGRSLRQTLAPFLAGATSARPLGGISGVRPGTPSSTVTATSTTWTVTPFAGVIDLEAAAIAGPYTFAFDANVSNTVTAANATNPRIDILSVRVNDGAEGDGTVVAPFAEIVYTAGVAAATPAAPATPARSFVIANINVPVSGGGSPTVAWNAPYTVAAGGIQPVSPTTYPASPSAGTAIYDQSLGCLLTYNGTGWVPEVHTSGARRVVANTNTFTAGVTFLDFPQAADAAALAINFTKRSAITSLVVRVSGSGQFDTGVAQYLSWCVSIGGTSYQVAQLKFAVNVLCGRARLSLPESRPASWPVSHSSV